MRRNDINCDIFTEYRIVLNLRNIRCGITCAVAYMPDRLMLEIDKIRGQPNRLSVLLELDTAFQSSDPFEALSTSKPIPGCKCSNTINKE